MDPVKKILKTKKVKYDDGSEQADRLERNMEAKLDKYLLERYG